MDFVKFLHRFFLFAIVLSIPCGNLLSGSKNLSQNNILNANDSSLAAAASTRQYQRTDSLETGRQAARGEESIQTDDSLSKAAGQPESLSGAEPENGGKAEAIKPEFVPKWHSMITNIPGDLVRWYDSEFTKEKIPYYLGITISTIGLIASDDATWKASDKIYKQNSFNKNMSEIFTDYGDGRSQFALAGLFAAYGLIDNNSRALRTASQIVEAVLASGGVVQVLKHVTGRESPFISKLPGGNWRFFPNQIEYAKHVAEYDAFPSGHVTTSLATVIVIAENYPEYKWIKPAGYTFTALLGIAMANKGIHWYSDYPLAIALGYSFGKLIANPVADNSAETEVKGKKVSFNLSPYYNGISSGFSFSMQF